MHSQKPAILEAHKYFRLEITRKFTVYYSFAFITPFVRRSFPASLHTHIDLANYKINELETISACRKRPQQSIVHQHKSAAFLHSGHKQCVLTLSFSMCLPIAMRVDLFFFVFLCFSWFFRSKSWVILLTITISHLNLNYFLMRKHFPIARRMIVVMNVKRYIPYTFKMLLDDML